MLQNRIKSLKHAVNGLKIAFKEEMNFRIHVIIAIFTLFLSFILKCSSIEIILLLLLFGLVIALELVNTAIEHIANFISPNYHEKIKIIKDISAAAVLVSAIVALSIGLILFILKIINLYS